MGTHPIFESDFDCLTDLISDYNATTNPRDQGIPLHCPAQGCLIGQDQEEHGKHQVQGTCTRWSSTTLRRPTSSVCPCHPGSRSRTSSARHKPQPAPCSAGSKLLQFCSCARKYK